MRPVLPILLLGRCSHSANRRVFFNIRWVCPTLLLKSCWLYLYPCEVCSIFVRSLLQLSLNVVRLVQSQRGISSKPRMLCDFTPCSSLVSLLSLNSHLQSPLLVTVASGNWFNPHIFENTINLKNVYMTSYTRYTIVGSTYHVIALKTIAKSIDLKFPGIFLYSAPKCDVCT